MSDIASMHCQHAATKLRLIAERNQIAAQIAAHATTSRDKAFQLHEIEAAFLKNATLEALGSEPTESVPDANILEKLRAEVAVSEPVSRQLAEKLAASERKLAKAEVDHKASIAVHLEDVALKPALSELSAAFDNLRDAAVNVMAAHHLTHRKFGDERFAARNAAELYGPVGEWLFALYLMDWSSYPYEIRPNWLPKHGRFWPDELPGVAERTAELLAEVQAAA